jgi:hypothetical protein
MSEWTRTPTKRKTEYGYIYYGGVCRDDYPNFRTYDQGGGNTIVTLQKPALLALLEAQVKFARASGWSKERIQRNQKAIDGKKYPEGRPIRVLPGTNRTCATQKALYADDPDRYADPKITGHTRGIAIDAAQDQADLDDANDALASAGWKRVRLDEGWHWSYGFVV